MNTKDNQRTRLSKMLLKNAMLELLKEKKAVNKITVKELCERAELNRSTFYAHYGEPKDLLSEIEDELISSVTNHLGKIGDSDDIANAHSYILSFLNYIRNNDKPFRTLLVETADTSFKNKFMNMATSKIVDFNFTLNSAEEQYVYSYILNGSASVIIQWLRSDYAIDENKLVELLFKMNKDLLQGVVIE